MTTKIYIGRGYSYQAALDAYKSKVEFEFVENSFAYCWITGMADADPIKASR